MEENIEEEKKEKTAEEEDVQEGGSTLQQIPTPTPDENLNIDLDRVISNGELEFSSDEELDVSDNEDSGVDEADLDLYDLELEDLDFKRPRPIPFWEQSITIKGRSAPGTSASTLRRKEDKRLELKKDAESTKKLSNFFQVSTAPEKSLPVIQPFTRAALYHQSSTATSLEPEPRLPPKRIWPPERLRLEAKEIETLLKSKKLEKTGGEAWKGQNRKRHEMVMRMLWFRAQRPDDTGRMHLLQWHTTTEKAPTLQDKFAVGRQHG